MILPIGDVQKPEKTPYINYALIGINIFVFLFLQPNLTGSEREAKDFFDTYAFIPAEFAFMKILYSMFMHANLLHIGFNMLFLWVAGDNVEDRLGKAGYAIFYLACGYVASLTHYALNAQSTAPLIGASGAIAGVMGAYFLLCPRNQVKIFVWFIIIGVFYIPARIVVGLWFFLQLFLFLVAGQGTGVAFDAHLGGIIFGFLATLVITQLRIATPYIATERYAATLRRGKPFSQYYTGGYTNPYAQYSNQRGIFTEQPEQRPDWISNAYTAPSYTPPWQQTRTGLFTVIAQKPIGGKIEAIAPVVASLLHTSPEDTANMLKANYGVIVKGVPGETAYSLEASLAQIGVTALPLGEEFTIDLPPVKELQGLTPGNLNFTLYLDQFSLTKKYEEIFLIACGNVAGVPTVDIYVYQPWTRFRIREGSAVFEQPALPNIRNILARMLSARSIAVNRGVKTLVDGGDWADASFTSQEDFDRYCYWLIQVVNARNRGLT
jgi:membrane associated rhomboid family serine protease